MKQFLLTALTAMAGMAYADAATVVYSIDATNTPVGSNTLTSALGLSVVCQSEPTKTFAAGTNNTIKFSSDKVYKIILPKTANITKAVLSGYDNYTTENSYLSQFDDKEFSATQYVFPNTKATVTHTLDFNVGLQDSILLKVSGKQTCLTIKLYSEEETSEQELKESRGYYSNAVTKNVDYKGASKVFQYPTPVTQMENLDRGLVALPEMNGKGIVLTWRLLGSDGLGKKSNTTFDVLRNGDVIKEGLTVTNFTDAGGTKNDSYSIRTRVNGEVTEISQSTMPWEKIVRQIQLDQPAATSTATYTPNDMSVGDLDGDKQYELIVKWDPSNSHDNSLKGATDRVYLDAYTLNGIKLWRIDLGKNIRAGAHYTQFLVYDFDGDGKAEVVCKTAPGSVDGLGKYVTEAATDADIKNADNTKAYANSNGYVNSGGEYLTIFNGETGAAMHTILYKPNRALNINGGTASYSTSWGDNYGGRGDRYTATVAYLDGPEALPSAVFERGYYTQCFVWAVDWNGTALSTKWLHYGDTATSWKTYDGNGKQIFSESGKGSSYGQGVHYMTAGDVNGDGYDEVITGSATIAHDGKLLCSTGFGHGDALHVGKLCPDMDGLQAMMPHEEAKGEFGHDVHDASTGKVIARATSESDNGRGMAADIMWDHRGYEFWSSNVSGLFGCDDNSIISSSKPASTDFRLYWDGDLLDELFDGKYNESDGCNAQIQKYKTTLLSLSTKAYGNGQSCNTTKATPCLCADILGDWREELILWDYTDPSRINIYSSNVPSAYAVPTLMHDHLYRMNITSQNSAYNQPPHLGYYLRDMFDVNYGVNSNAYATGIEDIKAEETAEAADGAVYDVLGRKVTQIVPGTVYIKNGKAFYVK